MVRQVSHFFVLSECTIANALIEARLVMGSRLIVSDARLEIRAFIDTDPSMNSGQCKVEAFG